MNVRKGILLLGAMTAQAVLQAAVTVDVLVAYDQSAARWLAANGEDGQALAAETIADMNTYLPPTGLDAHFSFRLAGVAFSAAEAAGANPTECLGNVVQSVADKDSGAASGAWKDVQAARDSYGADVVVVFVDAGEGDGLGGISWCMKDQAMRADPSRFAPWAYSACRVQYARTYAVIHEVGHLMGAGHSELLESDPGPQLQPYSSAYHFTDAGGERRHTVMGYSSLSGLDTGYVLYPAFSSAEFTTPDGVPLGDANHDNTRTLRETCVAVSKFRTAGGETVVSGGKFSAKTVATGKVVDARGVIAGLVQVTVAKTNAKGQSKVSAVFYGLDGRKRSAKALVADVALVDGMPAVRDAVLEVKGEPAPLVVTVSSDGSVSGTFGTRVVQSAASVADQPAKLRFRVSGLPAAIDGMPVLNDVESGGLAYHLVPDGDGVEFSSSGRKWSVAKAAVVKYAKMRDDPKRMEIVVDVGKKGEKSNLCGLALSVTPKTGVFRGGFTVYVASGTPERPVAKKMKFKVTGIFVDGAGAGQAVCRKYAADVFVERADVML